MSQMPQTAKAKATAQRIADIAATLFAENGFDATTISEVAANAGVAPGTVMLHFGSKSQLATAAFADQIATVVNNARPTTSGPSLTGDLTAFVTPIYDWYDAHATTAPDLLREALFSNGAWAEHYARTVANTVESFASILTSHNHDRSAIPVAAEGLLADYLLVLFQGFRGAFVTTADQAAHFITLAETRFA